MLILRRKGGESIVILDSQGRHAGIITVLGTGGAGKATIGLTVPAALRAERVNAMDLPASLRLHLESVRHE